MFAKFFSISMKKNVVIFTLLFLPFFSFAKSAESSKPVLNIQHWQTSNGAKVFFVQTPEIPMVKINVVFSAGSSRDGDKPGLAELTNTMLDQGTKTLNADQIAQKFDDVGANFGTTVNRDMAVVSLQSLTDPKYLNPALQVFTDVLTAPNFPQQAFSRTQKQTLNAIAEQQQIPDAVAKNAFYAATYDNLPYAHPTIGTQQSVSNLTANNLQNFYKNYYVAKNAMVTIVGALDRQQAETIANQLTNNLSSGEAAPSILLAPSLTQANQQHIKFPSAQTNILVGQIGINYQDPNYFPLLVGNYVLGGAPLTSRLFNEVREKRGLAYSVGSSFVPLYARGPFVIVLQTRNTESGEALKIVNDTMNDFIKQGPTENELAITKKKIINGFPLTLASNDAISNYLIAIGFYQLPLNYLDTYRQKVDAVTTQQIKDAFQQAVHPDRMVTVMVGNEKQQ
jgi:zinc protease